MKPLDADEVMAAATEHMLAKGKHAPMLFVSTSAGNHRLPVNGWPETTQQRVAVLFLLGRSFGQEHAVRHDTVSAIFLAAEVWVASVQPDELPRSVEQHPGRRECLSVLELRPTAGKTLEQTMYMAPILRHGEVVDLGPRETLRELKSPLLPSFFAGLGSSLLTDRQLLESMKKSQSGDL